MRRLLSSGLAFIFLAWTSGSSGVAAWREPPTTPPADSPSSTTPAPNDAPALQLERGLDKERSRNWSGAMEIYRGALEQWPSRVEFSRRLRLCEIHFKLIRRYADTSFRHVLLPLPQEQATTLYDEVLERIENHYVELGAI